MATTEIEKPTTKKRVHDNSETGEKLAQWIESNRKTVLSAVAVAIVAVGGIALAQFMDRRKELAAQEEIYAAELEWDTQKNASDKTEEGKDAKKDAKKATETPEPVKKVTKEELGGKYNDVLTKYRGAIEKNKGSKAAWVAALDLSNVYAEAGDYPQALQVLNIVQDQPPQKDLLYGLIQMAIGTSYLATKEAPLAIETFSKVVEEKSQVHLHPAAYIKLGLAQELAGDKAKAQQAFEKVRDEFPKSASAQLARSYLRYMILSENSK